MESAPHSNPSTPSQPSPVAARWVGIFIVVYILFQLLAPLRYYLAAPTSDERFAWRMFSYQGMHKCVASASEVIEQQGKRAVQSLDLGAVSLGYRLENNRPEVVAKFMRWRCEQPGVVQVRFVVRCTSPSGEKLEPRHYWMDRSDLIVREGKPES